MDQFAINIEITDADKIAVIKAIDELNKAPYVKAMSRTTIATIANMKETKTRMVLQTLMDTGEIARYTITANPRKQRYYFVPTSLGKTHLEQGPQGTA